MDEIFIVYKYTTYQAKNECPLLHTEAGTALSVLGSTSYVGSRLSQKVSNEIQDTSGLFVNSTISRYLMTMYSIILWILSLLFHFIYFVALISLYLSASGSFDSGGSFTQRM